MPSSSPPWSCSRPARAAGSHRLAAPRTDTVLGGRQAVTILTKLTWWCGGIFLVLSLILSLVPRGGDGASQLQQRLRATTPEAPPASSTLPLGTPAQPPAQGEARPGAPPATAPAAPAESGR